MSKGSGGSGKGGAGAGNGVTGKSQNSGASSPVNISSESTVENNSSRNYSPEELTHDVLPKDDLNKAAKKIAELTGMSEKDAADSIQAVRDFTSKSYEEIRGLQYAGKSSPEIEKINRYLEKMPKLKGEVLRGKGFKSTEDLDKFIADLKKGKSYQLPAMSSFTSSKSVAKQYADSRANAKSEVPAVLVVKNNKKGASIRNISEYKGEDEVIVPKGTKYKMAGKPYMRDGVWHIPLKED